jgi:arabinan endo-1,5-alpha-L-arabinosidase
VSRQRSHHPVVAIVAALLLAAVSGVAAPIGLSTAVVRAADAGTYRNPILPTIPGDGVVTSCADPTAIYGQEGESTWYMWCTTDPLNDTDKNASGDFNFHLVPQFSSNDLVHWVYEGDAFTTRPSYARSDAGLWAPEIEYYAETGQYHLYYTVTDTTIPTGRGGAASAIGVATSNGPLGPWTHRDTPVVEPHPPDCCPGDNRWVYDPEVIRTTGADYIYYGSYFGGISVRLLSEDGFTSAPIEDGDPTSGTRNVAIANKFEGAEVVERGGFWYLMASATDCCRGPLTGYSVFVGRAASPLGPFIDRDGRDLNDNEGPADPTDGRAGGTPVLSMSGNRFVGPGHNTVLEDFDGQWWTIYHAVDRTDPYFAGAVGFTKRPAMLDPVDWDNGWPVVRAYRYVSDEVMPAPAAQPGQTTAYSPSWLPNHRPGQQIGGLSDEFNDGQLSGKWKWVRPPSPTTYSESGGSFRFRMQRADLHESQNSASVLTIPAPGHNYMVETRIRVDTPPEGCCHNFEQAGLVIYANDDNYTKLVHVSIWNTRQTEWAKEVGPVPAGFPRYGNSIVGPPADWTYLRIVRTRGTNAGDAYGGADRYTAYSSVDGQNWRRGGTWTHRLGSSARIGLVSMGITDVASDPNRVRWAEFDYVRVYHLDR